MKTTTKKAYTVRSMVTHFRSETSTADTYAAAVEIAKAKGTRAQIFRGRELVASWGPVEGETVYGAT
jgi:hypothetical protein